MKASELDFDLPPELIAQTPSANREESRLLHYERNAGRIEHRRFRELPTLLRAGDLLVFNDAKVVPARFMLRKETGGHIEGLFLNEASPGRWEVLLRNLGKTWETTSLTFVEAPNVHARAVKSMGDGQFLLEVDAPEPALVFLSRVGRMPLPPYIKRKKDHDQRDELDRKRYQTVYARTPGAVAAPTAGLHFTPHLLDELARAGVESATLTLHVGLGTFKPVTADELTDHTMHVERYSIPARTADVLNYAKAAGRRIIAVGTTSVRVLESQPAGEAFVEKSGETGIFIHPPYQWRHVDALITNFHLPRSTLIALVAAMVGLDEQRRIYREAIERRYRFFSYGDAMLIE